MAQLFYEILNVVFSHLSRKELIQCQLTSKLFREASSSHLYASITINTTKKYKRYLLTISNSPHLAKYLKQIDVGNLFIEAKPQAGWDENELLYEIFQNCPNIIKFYADEPGPKFWNILNRAANQGRLKYLQQLPLHSVNGYDYYAHTALFFKDTLTTLTLFDTILLPTRAIGYEKLISHLKEFTNLQCINIDLYNNWSLSQHDKIIDDCKSLKTIKLKPYSTYYNQHFKCVPEQIQPRNDIETLQCYWGSVSNDSQLNYIMKKFPSLRNLKILLVGSERIVENRMLANHYGLSDETIQSFLEYIHQIPKFNVNLVLKIKQTYHISTEFLKNANNSKPVLFVFSYNNIHVDKIHMQFEENLTTVNFFRDNHTKRYPVKKLLSESGMYIHSLEVDVTHARHWSIDSTYRRNRGLCKSIGFFEVLELCPNLKQLTFTPDVSDIMTEPSSPSFRHYELKSLTLKVSGCTIEIGSISKLNLYFPNLSTVKTVHK